MLMNFGKFYILLLSLGIELLYEELYWRQKIVGNNYILTNISFLITFCNNYIVFTALKIAENP